MKMLKIIWIIILIRKVLINTEGPLFSNRQLLFKANMSQFASEF
jgi:hypothetical protein